MDRFTYWWFDQSLKRLVKSESIFLLLDFAERNYMVNVSKGLQQSLYWDAKNNKSQRGGIASFIDEGRASK